VSFEPSREGRLGAMRRLEHAGSDSREADLWIRCQEPECRAKVRVGSPPCWILCWPQDKLEYNLGTVQPGRR
jgi:hypothetical protein